MNEEESNYQQEQGEYERILSELPGLVKNRFENRTFEGEYPLSYGKYHYDNKYQDRRIKFYKDYSQNPLTELKEKQRIVTAQIDKKEQKIYGLAAESIRLAKNNLSKNEANALKDEIVLWLLAACREGEGYPGHGNGFSGLWDIDLNSLDIETESNLLQSKINQLNRHRAEWFVFKERQQIISDCYNKIALDDPRFKSKWNESTGRAGDEAKAVKRVVKTVRKKELCREALTKYLSLRKEYPNQTDNNLFEGDEDITGIVEIMGEGGKSLFYEWIGKLKEELQG